MGEPIRANLLSDSEFKDKFIAYVDILGFKSMVEAAEAKTGLSVSNLKEIRNELGKPKDREHIAKYGPTTCPESAYIRRDLDFQVTQVSDCVIVSAEASPAGVINLVHHCWRAAMMLLSKGVMVRGYIMRGSIYHEGNEFMGSGYHQAFSKERGVTAFKQEADERGTPFIEVDPVVSEYVRDHSDECVKEMFSRYVEEDGNVTAIFPFKRLSHSFGIGGFGQTFDPEKEKQSNQVIRGWLEDFKERVMSFVDHSNPDAVRKAKHYIAALDAQLEMCDKADEMIDALCAPFPAHRIDDFYDE